MPHLLLLEDDSDIRLGLEQHLKREGFTLSSFENGRDALKCIGLSASGQAPRLDVALLDLTLPDMDGLEVLAELKKINPNIKAVMLSGFGDVESAVNALKQGAFDYISKPFKVDDVIRVVNKAVDTLGQKQGQSGQEQSAGAVRTVQQPVSNDKTVKITLPAPGLNKMLIGAIAGGVLLLAAAGIFFAKKGILSSAHTESYSIPYSNPIGMCWIKPYLWVSDWVAGNIYQHNDDAALSIVSVYKTSNTQPTGLAFDGESLWTCSSAEKRIYKHKMDKNLSVTAIFATPNSSPAGLYFDGANLWILDTNAAKIYKHKMDDTLSIVSVFDSPAVSPCGMFRDGEFFYIGDYKTSRIYKVSVNDFSVREVYSLPDFEEGKNKLASITWDGANIWATADGVGKIFKMSFKSLKAIKF